MVLYKFTYLLTYILTYLQNQQEHSDSTNSAKAAAVSLCGDDHVWHKMPYLLRPLQWCPLVSDNISYIICLSPSVKENGKLILDPHPDQDQYQKLITSTGSPIAHVYHVWSTSVNALVSYPAHRMTEWMLSLNSASLGGVLTSCHLHYSTVQQTATKIRTCLNSLGAAAIPISSLKYWFHEKPFFFKFLLATSNSSSTLMQASLASALSSSPVDLLFLPFSAMPGPRSPGGRPSRPEIHCRLTTNCSSPSC